MRSYVSDRQRVALASLAVKRLQSGKLLIPPVPKAAPEATGGLNAPMIRTIGKTLEAAVRAGALSHDDQISPHPEVRARLVAEGLRLTLLAYNYVDASLDWRQPRHLNLQTPRRRPDSLRRNWADQHEVWEFPQASN